MKSLRAKLLVLAIAVLTVTVTDRPVQRLAASGQRVTLDNFDDSSIRVVYPAATNPTYHYLWSHQNVYGESGLATIDGVDAQTGTGSYRTVITPSATGVGDLYELFHPLVNNGTGIGNVRDFVQPSTAWQRDTFNRLVFWIKVPRGYQEPLDRSFYGNQNMNIGTYVRGSAYDGSGNQELGGYHFYHFYYIPYTGEWHQVIMDTHPSNTRTGVLMPDGVYSSGSADLWAPTRAAWTEHPTREAGYNYYDALTSFYIAGNVGDRGQLPPSLYPLVAHLDHFELYAAPSGLNVNQVYNLNGVFRPSDGYLYVGWNRNKADGTVAFDVRYSFTDVTQVGWNNAIPAPNGTGITPPDSGGYNLMRYEMMGFPMNGHASVFVAIKPQNSTSFNQIEVKSSPRPPDQLRRLR